MTRRSIVVGAAAVMVLPRPATASTLTIARELRGMVGFQVVGVDDVRQAWKSFKAPAGRFIELRQLGLFKETTISGNATPLAPAEVIIFSRPYGASLRQRFPGLGERVYHDYRLLIDGEFYHCVAWD